MNNTAPAMRWRAVALLSAIFGIGVSGYLLVEYTTGQAGLCLTGSGCDEVRSSDFAYPLGIPLPLFGVLFYAIAAWLSYRTLGARRVLGIDARRVLLLTAIAGVGISAVLTAIEAFVIGAYCTWCLASAVASAVLLVGAIGLALAPDGAEVAGQSSRARQQQVRARAGERRNLRRFAGWATAATFVLFAGLLVAGAAASSRGGQQAGTELAPPDRPRLGSGAVTVVEFADFQCPACAVAGPMLTEMAANDEITLVFRHFPLESIHANAVASSRAAEAAGRQGAFYSMAELLYARQAAWTNLAASDADSYFTGLAGEIGLDVAVWTTDYESAAVRNAVAADAAAAGDLGLRGTPSVFIGGELYEGELSVAGFRAAVQQAAARLSGGG